MDNSEQTSLGILVSSDRKATFKAACAAQNKSMKEVITDFVDRFISESGVAK